MSDLYVLNVTAQVILGNAADRNIPRRLPGRSKSTEAQESCLGECEEEDADVMIADSLCQQRRGPRAR
jgi:hypothetical protein